MLAAAGETCFTAGDDFAPPEDPDFERRARTIVAARDRFPLWGWKDPRTCLFLGFWEPILPQADFLFLYRHPVDVALSLWRRGNDPELRQDPWLSIRSWEAYNRRLLEFRACHPDRVFLANIPALTLDFEDFLRRLHLKLALPLSNGRVASNFVPEELAALNPPHHAWDSLIPCALALFRELDECADLPSRRATKLTAALPDRERDLLGASEMLLFTLLEKCGGPSARLLELEAALQVERARTLDTEARGARAVQVLAEIERSRSFAPVRAWWQLLRWLRK
jgi:hypothetical protein